MILFVALAGLGFQYLWPESLIWHEKSQAVIIPTIMASAVAFNRSFLTFNDKGRFKQRWPSHLCCLRNFNVCLDGCAVFFDD